MTHHRGAVACATMLLTALAGATAQAGMVEVGIGGDSSAHLAFEFRDARLVGGTFKELNEPNDLVIRTTAPDESVATFQDNRDITAVDNEYGHPHDCVAIGWRAVCQDSGQDVQVDQAYLGGSGDRATVSGSGDAELNGGPGNDTLIAQGPAGAQLSGDAGNDYVQGGPGDDRLDDDFPANDPGDDVLKGGDGNDLIFSAQGSDRIDAGAGSDSVIIRSPATPASIACGSGDDSLTLPVGSPIVAPLDCERVFYSG